MCQHLNILIKFLKILKISELKNTTRDYDFEIDYNVNGFIIESLKEDCYHQHNKKLSDLIMSSNDCETSKMLATKIGTEYFNPSTVSMFKHT